MGHCRPAPTPAELPRRAHPLPVAVPERPTEVFALTASFGSAVAWSVVVAQPGQSPKAFGGHLQAERATAVDHVVSVLRDFAAHGPVAVFTRQSRISDAASAIANVAAFPQAMAKHHHLGFVAQRELDTQLTAATQLSPRLTVATDGSWSRHTRAAGWAFLAQDGKFRQGSFDHATSPDAAELHAIWRVMRAFPSTQRLRILSDSRHAIAFIRDPSKAPVALRREATEIASVMSERDIQIQWVKGHTGAGLHDGADRLAVQARRTREANLARGQAGAVARRIVAESLAADSAVKAGRAHSRAA